MSLSSTYHLAFSENIKNTVSQEEVLSIFNEIETELHHNEVYSATVNSLAILLGKDIEKASMLIAGLTKEVIKLTVGKFTQQNPPVISTLSEHDDKLEISSFVVEDEHQELLPTKQPEFVFDPDDLDDFDLFLDINKPRKKLPKTEQKVILDAKNWRDRLCEIGKELQQARISQSLSLQEVYHRTFVPIRQIHALEMGVIEELPEDVYIRGFIRLIANALNLDGTNLVNSLPPPEKLSVVPSWYQKESTGLFNLSPIHLYLGYAAFMAGAAGGLVYISQNSTSVNSIKSQPNISTPASSLKFQPNTLSARKSGLKVNKKGVVAVSSIAAPENTSNNHSPFKTEKFTR